MSDDLKIPKVQGDGAEEKTQNTSEAKADPKLDFLQYVTYGLVFILFIGFAGCFVAVTAMMVDSFNSKEASYHELENQVQIQNNTINAIAKKLNVQ